MKFGIDYFPDVHPDRVSGYIRQTFGEIYPTFQISFGMMEKAKARRSMELFARHVMPQFH